MLGSVPIQEAHAIVSLVRTTARVMPGANGGIGGREEVKEPGSRDLGKGGDKVVNEVGKISPNAGSVSAYALKGAAIPAMGDETYNTSALVALALALLLPAALHKCCGS